MTGELRTPDGLRWVRSANNVLHAVTVRPSGRTVCGSSLDVMVASSFSGPRTARRVLVHAHPAICMRCDAFVEWVGGPDEGRPE